MIFALVGNQNCGKTTLFNCLTGSNQHVGNFPGVTVDQKSGQVSGAKDCTLVDLPGIYSIRPYSIEERVTRDFIFNQHPDGIINIIDATNPERNLYLTLQLLELRIPLVLVLNMMDEVLGNGGSIDVAGLEQTLGVPVIPVSAAKNEGVSEVVDRLLEVSHRREPAKIPDFCPSGPVHRCIHAVSHIIEDHAERLGISARFCATKVIEEDPEFIERLALDQNEYELIEHSVLEMETERGLDRNAALADMRYNFIEQVCARCVNHGRESREHRRSVRIDSVLTNRYLALPLFVLILLTVFWLTFDVIGAVLSNWLAYGIDGLTALVDRGLTLWGVNPVVHSLIVDGIFAGVGSVLSFLPIIVVLFFFLSVLEDTGYMAQLRAHAHRLRVHRAGGDGQPHPPLGTGSAHDDFAHPLHELFGEDPHLCGVHRRLFPPVSAPGDDRAVFGRYGSGGAGGAVFQELPFERKARPLRDGAAELSASLPAQCAHADVGKGAGFSAKSLHHHLFGHGSHLVSPNL